MKSNLFKIGIHLIGIFLYTNYLVAQRPYALGSFPNDGATHIFCNTFVRVHIHFPGEGKELDINSLTTDHIKLYPENRENLVVNAELQYDKNFQYLHLRPLEVLKPETDYVFEITPGLKDERGSQFLEFRLRFRTNNCEKEPIASRGPTPEPEPEIPQPQINLISAKAELKGSEVWIDWATKRELMQAVFHLKHSIDKLNFNDVGIVVSHGDSEEVQNYNFQDSMASYGMNYYNLAAYDIYGDLSYSDTLTVFRERVEIHQTTISKNASLPIEITVAPRTSMAFVLKNQKGKEVMRKAGFLPSDKQVYHIPLTDIPPGRYQVLLMTPQSRVDKKIEIVK